MTELDWSNLKLFMCPLNLGLNLSFSLIYIWRIAILTENFVNHSIIRHNLVFIFVCLDNRVQLIKALVLYLEFYFINIIDAVISDKYYHFIIISWKQMQFRHVKNKLLNFWFALFHCCKKLLETNPNINQLFIACLCNQLASVFSKSDLSVVYISRL